MHTNNQGAFYTREKDKRTRDSKVLIQATYHNIIILSSSAYHILLQFFLKHGGYMKSKTTVAKKYCKDLEEDRLEISPRFRITNANKRISDVKKEKLISLVEEYKEINSKPKQF